MSSLEVLALVDLCGKIVTERERERASFRA